MAKESLKGKLNKSSFYKKKFKNSSLYFSMRYHRYLKEQKREKRIEQKYGLEGMVSYIKKWYKKATGYPLDLDNPKTINDKLAYLKIYDQSPLKVTCSDKYAVREYVANKIGKEHLIPLIKIDAKEQFFDANEIDFDKLPNQFVLSCNHGSGMTYVIDDKNRLSKRDIKIIKKRLNKWLKIDYAYVGGFDFVYKGIKPCIMISEYLSNNDNDLKDYKITCFNGEIKYFWIDSVRFKGHKRNIYDVNLNKPPFKVGYFEEGNELPPQNIDKLFEIARKLAKDFKFARIDLYDVNGRIYFGEITLNSGGGRELIYPIEYNEIIGKELNIK